MNGYLWNRAVSCLLFFVSCSEGVAYLEIAGMDYFQRSILFDVLVIKRIMLGIADCLFPNVC
jgi:hypothetical protein